MVQHVAKMQCVARDGAISPDHVHVCICEITIHKVGLVWTRDGKIYLRNKILGSASRPPDLGPALK